MTVSGADSVRVRVHIYERKFRAKPVRVLVADVNGARTGGHRRRTRRCHEHGAVLPNECYKYLGRERPLFSKRGTSTGGWQRGPLTPRISRSFLLTTALTTTRAAWRAARYGAAKSHTAQNIAASTPYKPRWPARRMGNEQFAREGEHYSRVCVPPSPKTFIRKLRILDGVEFIEAPTFTAIVADYLEDDEYRALQLSLAGNPEAGDVIPGTSGFRKLRWTDRRRGKGKRGGLRAIYYYLSADAQIWLMTLYDKDEMADLSAAEKRALKTALEAELARRAARRRLRRK